MTERIRSKCLNCGQLRSCIKIEARAPLKHGPRYETSVESVWRPAIVLRTRVDYEADGPMVELCRGCLKTDPIIGSVLVKQLLQGLS